MSAQSRGGGGLRSRAPLVQWAMLEVWSPSPRGRWGVMWKERGGLLASGAEGALLEGRGASKHSLLSRPPLGAGSRPTASVLPWQPPPRTPEGLTHPMLVVSCAPEHAVIEAAGPLARICTPQARRQMRGPAHFPAGLPGPAWGADHMLDVLVRPVRRGPILIPPLSPWWPVMLSPHRQAHSWSLVPSAWTL